MIPRCASSPARRSIWCWTAPRAAPSAIFSSTSRRRRARALPPCPRWRASCCWVPRRSRGRTGRTGPPPPGAWSSSAPGRPESSPDWTSLKPSAPSAPSAPIPSTSAGSEEAGSGRRETSTASPSRTPGPGFGACWASRPPASALIRKNPAYGKILCRCGEITEGEVLDAIARGAVTLDGVKRRAGTGLGRCQGSVCAGKVMDLLSRALQVPVERLERDGPGTVWLGGNGHGTL